MKKQLLSIFTFVLISSTSVLAQLSTRSNDATVERLGARPQAGDMALTFGLNFSNLFGDEDTTAQINSESVLSPGNLLTFRYYKTNDVAYRAGIRLYKSSDKYKGTTQDLNGKDIADVEVKNSSRQYELLGGIEKHFDAANNFFDVYIAGDGYLGSKREVNVDNTEYKTGDKDLSRRVTSSAIVGIGGTVGFNIYVAHLPISLGLEYGWAAKWNLGGKTKVETETVSGSTSTSQEYFTSDNSPSDQFSDLKQREFQMETNSNVRIVANIYFGRSKK